MDSRSSPSPGHPNLFPATSWSLVRLAADVTDPTVRRESLETLLAVYRPLLVQHLAIRRRCEPAEAEDVVQQFICDKIIGGTLLGRANRDRGKLRYFLVVALDRFLISRRRSESARVDGPAHGTDLSDVVPDESELSIAGGESVDRQWAREVILLALARTETHLRRTGRPEAWSLFHQRVVSPALEGGARASLTKLAALLDVGGERRASNLLVTGRRAFAREIYAVMRDLGEAGDRHELLADLVRCASRAG